MSRPARAGTASRAGRLIGGAIAFALLAAVVAVAGPARVFALIAGIDPGGLALAAAAYAGVASLRGLRLALLVEPGRLAAASALPVAMAAQAAALLLPARIGELALPLLLGRVAGLKAAPALVTLVASRLLDVAALGGWVGLAALWHLGPSNPAVVVGVPLLIAAPLALPAVLAVADRLAVRLLAPRGLSGRRWARRVRRLARAMDALRARPWRLLGSAVVSVGIWAGIWLVTWLLLRAMGHPWQLPTVVAGASLASLTNLIPLSAVGNVGPLEAGWTAAFAALGIPVAVAAATGLACHLWTLLLVALFGALGWWWLGTPVLTGAAEAELRSSPPPP